MTHRRQALGREGERQAARFLEARGYRIVGRNVRVARIEIDLIARRGPVIAFVEVKSRRQTDSQGFGHHGAAAEAVDARKQARLRRGALAWLEANPSERRTAQRLRFDVVTCIRIKARSAHPAPAAQTPTSNPSETHSHKEAPQNDDTALPEEVRWSIEHWPAAF